MMLVWETTTCTKVLNAGVVQHLLNLLGPENKVFVWAEAANALRELSSKLISVKKTIEDEGGVTILINSITAPSNLLMQELPVQVLQECALGTLVNIFGGMHATVINLGLKSINPSGSDIHVADIVGALGYALKMFNENSNDAVNIEGLLFRQLKRCISKLVQECAIEALDGLYGNASLSKSL